MVDAILIELNESALLASGSSPSAVRTALKSHGLGLQSTIGGMRFGIVRRGRSSFVNLLACRD